MARQPFFGRGQGPQIARMDMNVATAPGRAYGQMFANLGKIAGDSIEKYAEGKKKKEEQDELIKSTKSFIMGNRELGKMLNIQATDGISYEEAVNQAVPSLVKNPKGFETIKGLTAMANQGRKAQQEKELFELRKGQYEDSAEDRKRLLEETEENQQKQMDMAEALLAETPDPAVLKRRKAVAQFDYNQSQPGLFALGGDQGARNRFLKYRRDEAPKENAPTVLGGELDSSNFLRYAREQNLDPVLAFNRFMKLRDREAEENKGTGKTMNVFDPKSRQNVITLQNPDGTPGRVVGIAPTQPPRIPDPKDLREANINKFEDNQAMATEADWKGRALTGRNTIQTVKTMLSTLDKVDDTGGFEPFKNTLRKYAMSVGVDFTDAEKEELANAEKFTQLSGEFVFKAISQTKGSISEKEMDLFQAMSPSMVNSKLGNRLMLEYAQKRADRDVRLNKEIQGWKKGGMLPQERVEMAMEWLNDPANDITQDLYEHTGVAKSVTNPPPQAQPIRPGVRGGNPPPNSNAQTPGGFIPRQIK